MKCNYPPYIDLLQLAESENYLGFLTCVPENSDRRTCDAKRVARGCMSNRNQVMSDGIHHQLCPVGHFHLLENVDLVRTHGLFAQ